MENDSLIQNIHYLYVIAFILACILSLLLCPVFRKIALHYHIMDHPNLSIKSHAKSTPYLGGAGIILAFLLSIVMILFISRQSIQITLSIQWLIMGGIGVFFLGFLDDIVTHGLSIKIKILVQFIISLCVLLSGLHVPMTPTWVSRLITIFWLMGIMNAINIIDVMDGLAGSVIFVASLAFFWLFLPTEIISKLLAIGLSGAVLGFLPYNLSQKMKMFMGDTGSLFLGYMVAVFSLNMALFNHSETFFIPILILGIPIFDTIFVMIIRNRKGLSPFRGSKDHFALRLRSKGYSETKILFISISATLFFSTIGWVMCQMRFLDSIILLFVIISLVTAASVWLAKIKENI
jgi:UDP-GlcNAc:undecaprenyl-phosphate/decaprenyl-phosphate GlcNAc-1-phosphate transferase